MNEKVLGIIGGMGPEATVELMKRVVKGTPVAGEEDHIRILVDNNPKVPSRMKALIEGTGESPGPYLAQMACSLEAAGADFLAMPCMTAHYYFEEISSAVTIPVMNMVRLSIDAVLEHIPTVRTIAVLASTAVLKTELFEKAAGDAKLRFLSPAPSRQGQVLTAIKRIKKGDFDPELADGLQEAAEDVVKAGAEAIIVACTELSLIADKLHARVPIVDSLQSLSDRIVLEAGR